MNKEFNDELNNRRYQYREYNPFNGMRVVAENGNLDDNGFNDRFYGEYNINGLIPFYARENLGDFVNNKYGIKVGDDNLNASYYQTNNQWGKTDSAEIAKQFGLFNLLLGLDKQNEYKNYRAELSGGNKDINGSLSWNKDNMGNNSWWVNFNKAF